jgi:hypothetical protein
MIVVEDKSGEHELVDCEPGLVRGRGGYRLTVHCQGQRLS